MAEAVLNSPGPNSPKNTSKTLGSDPPSRRSSMCDPPSRRSSVCSVHSDNGIVHGILHDSTGIGLSVPSALPLSYTEGQGTGDYIWKGDDDELAQRSIILPRSPVALRTLTTTFNAHHAFTRPEGPGGSTDSQFHWK
jgi:hypothetical protein